MRRATGVGADLRRRTAAAGGGAIIGVADARARAPRRAGPTAVADGAADAVARRSRLASARTGPSEVRPLARLEPDEAARRRRDADAAATVRSVGERHHPGGHARRPPPPLDPPGVRVEVPRVVRRSPRDRLRASAGCPSPGCSCDPATTSPAAL